MKKRILVAILSLLLILTLLLVACTKATPTTTTPAKTTTTAVPTTTATTVKPTSTAAPTTGPAATTTAKPTPTVNKYGGKVTYIWNDTSPLMGFPTTNSQPGQFYGSMCVQGLLSGTLTPYVMTANLATKWDLAADKSSYTFTLRKGVKFSDGNEMKAADVKFAVDNAIATGRAEIANAKSCDIIDDYTVRVNLKKWDALTLGGITGGVCGVISKAAYDKNGKEWAQVNPVGTGAWLLKEMVQSQYTYFVKNPNYWDPQYPYLDEVKILAVKDMMTRQAVLLNGDADGAREMDANSLKNLMTTGKFVFEQGAMGNFQIGANTSDPTNVWANKNMRLAIEYALDKQLMSDGLGLGFTEPSYEVIGGVWQVAGNKPTTTFRKYDPAKALQLMKEAGYASGVKCTMEMNQKFYSDFAVAVQNQLSKVGINVDLQVVADTAWQDRRLTPAQGNTLRFERGRGGPSDVLNAINSDLASNAVTYPGVKRPAGWDDMLAQAMASTDAAKIMPIINKMEELAYGEVMSVPVYIQYNLNIWSNKLRTDRPSILVYAGNDNAVSMNYAYWPK